jgi:hypothetical protein
MNSSFSRLVRYSTVVVCMGFPYALDRVLNHLSRFDILHKYLLRTQFLCFILFSIHGLGIAFSRNFALDNMCIRTSKVVALQG